MQDKRIQGKIVLMVMIALMSAVWLAGTVSAAVAFPQITVTMINQEPDGVDIFIPDRIVKWRVVILWRATDIGAFGHEKLHHVVIFIPDRVV